MPILVIVQEVCSTSQVPQIQKQQPRLPYLGPDDATPDRLVGVYCIGTSRMRSLAIASRPRPSETE